MILPNKVERAYAPIEVKPQIFFSPSSYIYDNYHTVNVRYLLGCELAAQAH